MSIRAPLAGLLVCVIAMAICAVSCGSTSAGSTTPTTVYPSIAGTWTGTLSGSSAAASAAVRIVLQQSTELTGGGAVGASSLQRISGTWSGTDSDGQITGNFNGGIDSQGRAQFTLVTNGTSCNLYIDVTLTSGRLIGTYSSVGPNGCQDLPVSPTGAVTLLKE